MVHVKKGVKDLFLILCIFVHAGVDLSLVAGEEQIFHLDDLYDVLFLPSFSFAPSLLSLRAVIELKVLKFKVKFILNELLDALHVGLVKFRYQTGADESMFESEPDFLAIGEDELVEVVEYKLEGLWVGLVDLDDLRDAAGVEGLVLDVAEVTKDFLDLVLHMSC